MKKESSLRSRKHPLAWSALTLCNQMKRGNVNFDNAIQRSLVWDKAKKSLLIHSMIEGYDMPPIYFYRSEDGVYESIDGKQRSNAIYEYMNDGFPLDTVPSVLSYDGEETVVTGLRFSELPEWAQDCFRDYNLTVTYFENVTDAEIREQFRRLNNGKALTAMEVTRVNTPSLKAFQKIAKHPAIQTVTTEAAKKRFEDEKIAMQIYHLLTEREPDFSTKTFRAWAESTEVDESAVDDINKALDVYGRMLTELAHDKAVSKTLRTRTHFVSIAYFCAIRLDSGAGYQDIKKEVYDFINGGHPTTSEEYNKTVGAGSAKPQAVQTRQKVMQDLARTYAENDLQARTKAEYEQSNTQNTAENNEEEIDNV